MYKIKETVTKEIPDIIHKIIIQFRAFGSFVPGMRNLYCSDILFTGWYKWVGLRDPHPKVPTN